jgi:hypothetical protein
MSLLTLSALAVSLVGVRVGVPHRVRGPQLRADDGLVRGIPTRVLLLVQGLADEGATKSQLEDAFATAIDSVFFSAEATAGPPSSSSTLQTGTATAALGPLKEPRSTSEAQTAFRKAFARFQRPPIKARTQKFLNVIIEDRACLFRFEYNAVYALGFTTLCDTFLRASCNSPEDVSALRSALCFGLGLDGERVASDAQAVVELAERASSSDELLEADIFAAISSSSASRPMKYTYAFGVGLVLLMQLVGETELTDRSELNYGASYKGPATEADPAEAGAITRWCASLNLDFAARLDRDSARPLSIDGIGRFSFEDGSRLVEPGLRSIGVEGSF